MRVASDYKVHTLVHKKVRYLFLTAVLQQHILYAPVDSDNDNLGTGLTRAPYLVGHPVFLNQSHLYPIARLNAVGSVCIIQKTDLDTVYILYKRDFCVAVGSVVKCSDVIHAKRVERGDSAPGCFVTAVKAMVIGREEHVEPGIFQCRGI